MAQWIKCIFYLFYNFEYLISFYLEYDGIEIGILGCIQQIS